jgi:hypothetical protein
MLKKKPKQYSRHINREEGQGSRYWRDIFLFIVSVLLIIALADVLKISPAVVLLLIALFYYVKLQRSFSAQKKYSLLHIGLLFVIFLAVSDTVVKSTLPVFYLPFSIIPMLAAILFFNLEIPLLLSVASAITLMLLVKNNLYLGLIALISGIISSFLVIGARRRSQIIRAGFFVGLVQMVCLFFIEAFKVSRPEAYTVLFMNGFTCGVAVAGILPIFEYLFKVITNISLLELSDFNHPLLRLMILKAPGTYHHSLVVGNLAEQACEAVAGANSLLARVGAYYHDIGKIEKAEYFSENQNLDLSKHDELAPSMSKLVIINHVKEGVELARKYRLNPKIIDFIQQHHGTSIVYYFYRRALESAEQEQQVEEVREEGFRYFGPRPGSKETAIVLLADSVEAACRSVRTPTHSKVEEMVRKIINNKFIDGQLDECDLTLRDLEKIASVFVRILDSIYHARVTYPEKESENSNTKSPKENSRQLEETKEAGP